VNGTDTVTRAYDAAGNLQSETSQANASTVSYSYLGGYLPHTVALNGTEIARYSYQGDFLSAIAAGGTFGFEYDAQGRRTALTRPNGQRTTYTYAPDLPWLQEIGVEGSPAALGAAYTHDVVGNRLTKNAGGVVEQYGYDALDRLTRVLRTAPTSTQSSFTYDGVGNRVRDELDGISRGSSTDAANRLRSIAPASTVTVRGTTSEPATVTVQGQPARILSGNVFEAEAAPSGATPTVVVQASDGSGNTRTSTYQLPSTTAAWQFTYDANGSLSTKTDGTSTWNYTWDAEDRLIQVARDGSTLATFAYDAFGRRVRKVAGGVTTSYTYDGADIVRESRGGDLLKYVHGPGIDEPLAVDAGGTRSYFHADGLGSIVATTDSSGNVTSRRQYDAWGNLEVGADQPGYAFTGREWDPETGLYYYRARYYDPKIGRFISEDPIGFAGGPNAYAYVGNLPTSAVDPLGLIRFVQGGDSRVGGPANYSDLGRAYSEMARLRATLSDDLVQYMRQAYGFDIDRALMPGGDIVVELARGPGASGMCRGKNDWPTLAVNQLWDPAEDPDLFNANLLHELTHYLHDLNGGWNSFTNRPEALAAANRAAAAHLLHNDGPATFLSEIYQYGRWLTYGGGK